MFMFPPELAPILILLITDGLKSLFGSISGFGTVVVAAAVGAVLMFGESVINALGPGAADAATLIVELLMILLSGMGLHENIKKFAK